jgi:hypothetical protein
MARISRSGDTDETITIPRPDDRSTIQPQQTRKATMKDSHSPLRILPDGDDLERIIAHAPRREERRRLQLLAAERSYFDALETRHGRPPPLAAGMIQDYACEQRAHAQFWPFTRNEAPARH